jgi:DNA-binding response OmpR family regulator
MTGENGARDGEPSAETDRPQDPTGEDARPTILVVEDHAEMRTFLREQLKDQWQIRLAENGVEGWRCVQENPPDLVLSDVMMPEMDGVELCARIKDDDTLQTIPVILLTARSETDATVEGLRGGADDYLEKPFDVTELRQRIDSQLAAHRRLRDRYRQEVHLDTLDVTIES